MNERAMVLSLPFSFYLPSTFDATPYPIVRRERSPRCGPMWIRTHSLRLYTFDAA